jgi:hypothetical protein
VETENKVIDLMQALKESLMRHNPEHDEAPPQRFTIDHEYDDCFLCRQFPKLGFAEVTEDELPSNYEGYGPPDDS